MYEESGWPNMVCCALRVGPWRHLWCSTDASPLAGQWRPPPSLDGPERVYGRMHLAIRWVGAAPPQTITAGAESAASLLPRAVSVDLSFVSPRIRCRPALAVVDGPRRQPGCRTTRFVLIKS
jgi:hypothetical protein